MKLGAQRPETRGGRSPEVGLRMGIIYFIFYILLKPSEIASLIVSPRVVRYVCETVGRFAPIFETFWHVGHASATTITSCSFISLIDTILLVSMNKPELYLDDFAHKLQQSKVAASVWLVDTLASHLQR
jgi:hypothetical protein